MAHTKITGTNHLENMANVDKFASKVSARYGYALVSIIFGEVSVYAYEKLPSSAHAPSDWPLGYWHKGQRQAWSDKRIIKCQNACSTRD